MFEQNQKYCNTYITDKIVISGDKFEKYSYSVPIMCDFNVSICPKEIRIIQKTEKERII